ncbi:BZ3500_MvSof-1268-A1-R1_Chr1-2g01366 [Microbotryum saponariae]|uniref:BZ3500_MvSof-1268-A1-R1_Chr1-2g01366 protein n=1 Tax=Microbotryum saponariae TaxID=289078 RepID=A0A2X0KXP5_9BASI|nr:BZ3500_MvSof-1268-A1-R1_Chr1-2g01366 [Microbotryum saponariae]SCZ97218.1 BZ3501_MvSof-1269-A2-R1_Chr1-2g00965 [Microbotryum saponariae]
MAVDGDAKASKGSKRKTQHDGSDSDSADDGTDTEMLDVSFDFFDPQPQDYHSIKLLLTQLLSHDAPLIDIGSIANLVLEQKLVGSTVKTDGSGADPYAVLSVLNLNLHKVIHRPWSAPSIASLIKYLGSKLSTANPEFAKTLDSVLSNSVESSTATTRSNVGLVISERLVNMPAQVVPPMYRMLQEELQWARDDKEPYHFSHLLFLSRVFLSSAEQFEQDPNANINTTDANGSSAAGTTEAGKAKGGKKNKKGNTVAGTGKKARTGPGGSETRVVEEWMYHAEDEMIKKASRLKPLSSLYSQTFAYSTAPNREGDDPFGVETKGLAMLVEYDQFDGIVQGMEAFLGGPTPTA